MPSLRSLMSALPFALAATLVLAPVRTVSALASPAAFPMPFVNANRVSYLSPNTRATGHNSPKRSHLNVPSNGNRSQNKKYYPEALGNSSSKDSTYSYVPAYHTFRSSRRDISNFEPLIQSLSSHRDNAESSSQDLRRFFSY